MSVSGNRIGTCFEGSVDRSEKETGDDIGWIGWEGDGNKLLDENKKEKKRPRRGKRETYLRILHFKY